MFKDQFVTSDHIWLNAASEGPLPKCAHTALEEAVGWKSLPYQLNEKFARVPVELKQALGRLMGVPPADVILGSSTSYGLFVLTDGFPWEEGDEVLVMENDFPTNILPWLALEDKGVVVRQLKPAAAVLTPEELEQAIGPQTKWICLSHVHTFSGWPLKIGEMAKLARARGVYFVVNVAQSLGNSPVDLSAWDVDAAVGVGYKWLCGPYGTGFAWIRPELRQKLQNRHPYWPVYLSEAELQAEEPLTLKKLTGARALDMSGTANFFNFVPLKAAVDFWLEAGPDKVYAHNDHLVGLLLAGLDRDRYTVLSPEDPETRTPLVVLSAKDRAQNKVLFERLVAQKIHPAYWKHHLRFSPHVYNTPEDIQALLKALHKK